jgi:hypothetical protein
MRRFRAWFSPWSAANCVSSVWARAGTIAQRSEGRGNGDVITPPLYRIAGAMASSRPCTLSGGRLNDYAREWHPARGR